MCERERGKEREMLMFPAQERARERDVKFIFFRNMAVREREIEKVDKSKESKLTGCAGNRETVSLNQIVADPDLVESRYFSRIQGLYL